MDLSEDDWRRWTLALATQPSLPKNLMTWVTGPMRDFFAFERCYLCHGQLSAGRIQITHSLSHGHSDEYLQQLHEQYEAPLRGTVTHWLKTREPFYIDPATPSSHATRFELDEIRVFGMKNVVAHGVLNLKANAGTYFSFSGVHDPLGAWHLGAMRVMAPALHDLFLQFAHESANTHQADVNELTPRQKGIVRQLTLGQNNKEVAQALSISEKTVRNQLTEIFRVMDVSTRTQLIAKLS
jgi:DNA-binding CsgD family transcriptional regulator